MTYLKHSEIQRVTFPPAFRCVWIAGVAEQGCGGRPFGFLGTAALPEGQRFCVVAVRAGVIMGLREQPWTPPFPWSSYTVACT